MSKDCKQKRPGQSVPTAVSQDKAKIDEEVSDTVIQRYSEKGQINAFVFVKVYMCTHPVSCQYDRKKLLVHFHF